MTRLKIQLDSGVFSIRSLIIQNRIFELKKNRTDCYNSLYISITTQRLDRSSLVRTSRKFHKPHKIYLLSATNPFSSFAW